MEIHQVIKNLCKVLQLLNVNNLKPELFRRAKHNCNLLNASILMSLLDKAVDFIEKGIVSSRESQAADFQASVLECKLRELGYSGKTDGNDCRGILIAMSWIIATYSLVDNLIFNMLSSSPMFSNENLILMLKEAGTDMAAIDSLLEENKTEDELINNSLCLYQKLKCALKLCQVAAEENVFLHFKVSSHFHNNDEHIRRYIISKNPDLLEKLHLEYEKLHQCLDAYFKWKENEKIFWRWMESVLQLKVLNEKISPKHVDTQSPQLVQNVCHELENDFKNLNVRDCSKSDEHLKTLSKYISSCKTVSGSNERKFSDLLMDGKFKCICSGSNLCVQTLRPTP